MSREHAALMDGVYRRQRHFYDATRKYFLFGRDALIARMALTPHAHVLEIGCGTGRNMVCAARCWPGARFYGIDISDQMLATARANVASSALSDRVMLRQGDATRFEAAALFGRAEFDVVFFSYTLSMIPDWRGALQQGFGLLAPQGRALAVDFGDQAGLPALFRAGLRRWLTLFHVTPREGLREGFAETAQEIGAHAQTQPLYGGYAWLMEASSSQPA